MRDDISKGWWGASIFLVQILQGVAVALQPGYAVGMTQQELETFEALQSKAQSLRDELSKVIVGQQDVVDHLVLSLFCQGHTLLVGVPGLAKTLLVRTLSQVLGWEYKRIQFTPDMMPSDVTGAELIQQDEQGRREMVFEKGPIFANLVLADEINRTPPRTQAALLEAMAERQVTAAGQTMMLPEPFVVIATQNPIEQEGTYPLPEAQLDRFMFSLKIAYPSAEEEKNIIASRLPGALASYQHNVAGAEVDTKLNQVFDIESCLEATRLICRMPVSDSICDYTAKLVRSTRPQLDSAPEVVKKYVAWGAGPRAGMYLLLAARAKAALEGEPTVNESHIQQVTMAVLGHRVVTNYTATGEGVETADILRELLNA